MGEQRLPPRGFQVTVLQKVGVGPAAKGLSKLVTNRGGPRGLGEREIPLLQEYLPVCACHQPAADCWEVELISEPNERLSQENGSCSCLEATPHFLSCTLLPFVSRRPLQVS